jgi:hypothetical protein
LKAIPLPQGAILVMAYKCICLQFSYEWYVVPLFQRLSLTCLIRLSDIFKIFARGSCIVVGN